MITRKGSRSDYIDTLNNATVVDGLNDMRSFSSLSQSPAYQRWWSLFAPSRGLAPGATVASYFNSSAGLNAFTLGWDIQTIFLRGRGLIDPARIAHEAFHLMGLVDSDIQSGWGLSVNASDTSNITRHFRQECL